MASKASKASKASNASNPSKRSTLHDIASLEQQNVETEHKLSPEEAAMWIQLIAFPRLDGQYLLDAAADVVQRQLGAATIAKRSLSKEWRLVRSESQSDDDEAS